MRTSNASPAPGFVTPPPQSVGSAASPQTPSTQAEIKMRQAVRSNLIRHGVIGKGTNGLVYKATLTVTDAEGVTDVFECVAKRPMHQSAEQLAEGLQPTPEFLIARRLMSNQTDSVDAGTAKPICILDGYELYAPGICSLENCKKEIAKLYTEQTNTRLHQNIIFDFLGFLIRALQLLQDGNAVHADLKPANIVYRRTEKKSGLLMIDFGCSTHNGYCSSEPKGTPLYVAPEVLVDGVYSFAADIYAFGIMLDELMGNHVESPQGVDPYVFLYQLHERYKKQKSTQPKKTNNEPESLPDDFYGIVRAIILKMKEFHVEDRANLAWLIEAYNKLNAAIETKLPEDIIAFYVKQSENTQPVVNPVVNMDVDSLASLNGENGDSNNATATPAIMKPSEPRLFSLRDRNVNQAANTLRPKANNHPPERDASYYTI